MPDTRVDRRTVRRAQSAGTPQTPPPRPAGTAGQTRAGSANGRNETIGKRRKRPETDTPPDRKTNTVSFRQQIRRAKGTRQTAGHRPAGRQTGAPGSNCDRGFATFAATERDVRFAPCAEATLYTGVLCVECRSSLFCAHYERDLLRAGYLDRTVVVHLGPRTVVP